MVSSNSPSIHSCDKTLNELKIKAKLALKAYRKDPLSLPKWAAHTAPAHSDREAELKLKNVLCAVAKKVGFTDWQHALHVLGGEWHPGEDAGTFWYSPKCGGLLNIWCRDLSEAEEQLNKQPGSLLFPYKKQFDIADEDYVNAIGLHNQLKKLRQNNNRNLAALYGRTGWDEFSYSRVSNIFNP
ncbi:MAG: hypothetical protein JKX94_05320 [Sneathiella sp.]|nr:hypothetical protein [Sneathiella sp.]